MSTAAQPKSKLFSFVETNRPGLPIVVVDRKYWSETAGVDYIQQLAFKQDVEAIKVSVGVISMQHAASPLSVGCRFLPLSRLTKIS